MVLGLLISRLDLAKPGFAPRLILLSLATALAGEGMSNLLIRLLGGNKLAMYLFSTKPMNPGILYILASSAWALLIIGLYLALKSRSARVLAWPPACGQLALTHYLTHSIILSL